MSQDINLKANCLCGKVEIHGVSSGPEMGACHCTMCRKWSGAPMMTLDCNDSVSFIGEEYITSYSSSEWGERGFCSVCGTHLFYKLKPTGQHFVPAGLFEQEFHFDHQIFIDEKPEYYSFADKTKDLTGAQVFAEFSGE